MRSPMQTCLLVGLVSAPAIAQQCGSPWTVHQGPGPSARAHCSIAYDSFRGRVVLFGGMGPSGNLSDTWEWAAAGPGGGGSWTQVSTSGPPAVSYAGMAYDSHRRRTVLFGGYTGTSALTQTWEWDGASWIQVQTALSPPPTLPLLAFDPVRARTVALGIDQPHTGFYVTWEYDGTSWSRSSEPSMGVGSQVSSVSFDLATSTMVAVAPNEQDVFVRTSTGWQAIEAPDTPSYFTSASAFDSTLSRIVSIQSGIWSWDPARQVWEVRNTDAPAIPPDCAIVHDGAGSQLLIFGGYASSPSGGQFSQQTILARSAFTSGPIVTSAGPRSFGLAHRWLPGTLHAEASGSGSMSYQWRRNGVNLTDGGSYSGTRTPHLTIDPATWELAGEYDAVISDACGTVTRPATTVYLSCYADCDHNSLPPQLGVLDFWCFVTRFAAGQSYANCDGSTAEPTLNANDFMCFLNMFAQGC